MNQAGPLPAAAHPGGVHLRVGDAESALGFYAGTLGLEPRTRGELVELRAAGGERALVVLRTDPDARARPPRSAGLFHLALRVPGRADLGAVLSRLLERGTRLQGASDHGVSEALYLADPDGNGIELYRDRPREAWPRRNGALAMGTAPLDVRGLAAAAGGRSAPLPAGTDLGHVHLNVTDLDEAEAFYGPAGLGLDVTVRDYPGARFLAAGGYHHHLGVNTWGVEREADAGARGMIAWTLVVPGPEGAAAAAERVGARAEGSAWIAEDPSGNTVILEADAGG